MLIALQQRDVKNAQALDAKAKMKAIKRYMQCPQFQPTPGSLQVMTM
jgi:hypothetical protein